MTISVSVSAAQGRAGVDADAALALAQMHAAAERMERICADLKEFIDGEVERRREEIARIEAEHAKP